MTTPGDPTTTGTDAGRGHLEPALGIIAVVAIFHLMLMPRVADPDAFYHMGHAAQYLRTGPWDTAFPWTAFSVVSTEGADLWWGFHLLLLPFALIGNVALAIGMAGMALTALLLGGVLWIARRHDFVAAGFWPVFFFVAVPNVLFRYVMVRPEMVSLLLALVLTSLLARGRLWAVAAASAGITFVHLSMFWLPPGILAAYFTARVLDRLTVGPSEPEEEDETESNTESDARPTSGGRRPWWALVTAVLLGAAAGWLLRPHPFAAARLAWVQIGLLFTVKAQGGDAPLTFATSLSPLTVGTLLRTAGPMVVVWAGGVALGMVAFFRRSLLRATPATERHFLWTTHAIAAPFLLLTVMVARRSLVQWEAFGVMAFAASLTWLATGVRRRIRSAAVGVATLALLPWAVHRHALNVRLVAVAPDRLAQVATWLEENTRPGDLVFNTHWDEFGPLFARDRDNRYLGGMDPIFQYAYDAPMYWRFHYLSTDRMADHTCSTWPCTPGTTEDTWDVLAHRFGARWILVEPRRNPRLSRYLLDDPRYEVALETQHEAVFRVLDGPEPPSP